LLFEATGENLRRRVEELDAIARVSTELTLTIELDKIHEVIRQELITATHSEHATIALVQPDEDPEVYSEPVLDRRIGDMTGGFEFLPLEAHVLNDVGSEAVIVRDYAESELKAMPVGTQSAAASAIIYNDDIVGVIHVYDSRPNVFDDR